MATSSSIPAWKKQRSLAGYSPWGHKRKGHDWVPNTHICMYRKKQKMHSVLSMVSGKRRGSWDIGCADKGELLYLIAEKLGYSLSLPMASRKAYLPYLTRLSTKWDAIVEDYSIYSAGTAPAQSVSNRPRCPGIRCRGAWVAAMWYEIKKVDFRVRDS